MAREELKQSGNSGGKSAASAAPPQPRFVDWLDWLPWEKILIWGLFLLAVYTLRSFFMIIFLTFILSYTMRSIVLRISRLVVPWRECVWLERVLTLVCFVLLLFGLYKAGEYLGPRIKAQAEGLVEKVTPAGPTAEVASRVATSEMNVVGKLIQKSVGAYLFQKNYGMRGDARY
jgi:predicted PurR-regulated permease PerM